MPHLAAILAKNGGVQSPRNIILSGEKQCAHVAHTLMQFCSDARVTGVYAPSATGIWTTAFPYDRDLPERPAGVTAVAIPGFEHRILNKSGAPAPLGTAGELHIRGSGADFAATGVRAAGVDGNRARWLRGCEHTFVKCECCVELTDIEAVLCRHDAVHAAEVIDLTTEPGAEGVVVAFVLADPDHVSGASVRDFLLLQPDVELVPDRVVVVPEFPLTAEGAIDHHALIGRLRDPHAPSDDARSAEAGHRPPSEGDLARDPSGR
jgi:acyl-coenzyme A synthetase/AMP-(fatty) acid ligase